MWGVLLTAWDVWRRIPKQHRKQIYGQVRKHAPTVARTVAREAKRARTPDGQAALRRLTPRSRASGCAI